MFVTSTTSSRFHLSSFIFHLSSFIFHLSSFQNSTMFRVSGRGSPRDNKHTPGTRLCEHTENETYEKCEKSMLVEKCKRYLTSFAGSPAFEGHDWRNIFVEHPTGRSAASYTFVFLGPASPPQKYFLLHPDYEVHHLKPSDHCMSSVVQQPVTKRT